MNEALFTLGLPSGVYRDAPQGPVDRALAPLVRDARFFGLDPDAALGWTMSTRQAMTCASKQTYRIKEYAALTGVSVRSITTTGLGCSNPGAQRPDIAFTEPTIAPCSSKSLHSSLSASPCET